MLKEVVDKFRKDVYNLLTSKKISFVVSSTEEMVKIGLKFDSQYFMYLLASEYLEFLESNFPLERTYEIPLKGEEKTVYVMVSDSSIAGQMNDLRAMILSLKKSLLEKDEIIKGLKNEAQPKTVGFSLE